MFGFTNKKRLKRSLEKIKEEIKDLKKDIVSKSEIELIIENKILKLREANPQTSQTPIRKRVNKLLNKAEIMQEIRTLEQQGLSTTEAYDQIVNIKGLCRKSCFYKYLKIVRGNIAQTPQTDIK